jgi:hypothetical protein
VLLLEVELPELVVVPEVVSDCMVGSVVVPVASGGVVVVLSGVVVVVESVVALPDIVVLSVVVPVSVPVAVSLAAPLFVASCFVQAVASINAARLPIKIRLRFI